MGLKSTKSATFGNLLQNYTLELLETPLQIV